MVIKPAYRYHIHADIPGKFSLSTKHDARAHASGSRDIAVEVKSLTGLVDLFRKWAIAGERVESLDFHTHGSPGVIHLGNEGLSANSIDLQRIVDTGVRKVFAPKCTVTFSGCNVAEEPQGEAFLAEVGKAMLFDSGGSTRANTAKGLMDPFGWLSPTHVWHPPIGTWVTATVQPGGAVTLDGHVWLYPNRLREVAAKLEPLVRPMPDTRPTVPLGPPGAIGGILLDTRYQVIAADSSLPHLIDAVWKLLGREASYRPAHSDTATACLLLRHIARKVRR